MTWLAERLRERTKRKLESRIFKQKQIVMGFMRFPSHENYRSLLKEIIVLFFAERRLREMKK